MRTLVTGAGGFLGQYLVEQLLARGDSVRCLSRGDYPQLRALGAETLQGDLRDADAVRAACRGREAVFHAAGVAGIWGPWEHYYGINTLGTQNVVQACQREGVPRLVYTSSPSVTFGGTDQRGVDEREPYPQRWLCHYPHSKALAEQYVLAADGQRGLRSCALRPHLIWGPRDQHLIPRLVARARQGKLVRVGRGNNRIDMVYVENAARAHLQACDALRAGATVCGRAYYLSQGQPVNCWDWINEILAAAGLPPVRRSLPYALAWWLGWTLELVYATLRWRGEPRMTRFLAAQLATSHYFRIERAQRDFGYAPHISTEEGMRRLASWLSNVRGLNPAACQSPED